MKVYNHFKSINWARQIVMFSRQKGTRSEV